MAYLSYKTRDNADPAGKPRVYLCCHPQDLSIFLEPVSRDILDKEDCAVWYADSDALRDEEFYARLAQMQLFVMPVTTRLLHTENDALDQDFRFAMERHIHVLPLMQEHSLEVPFAQKCGDLQFLDALNTDPTAISYDQKLKKHLSTILIGDEQAQRIRAAFTARAFLSYRKKDRKHAQELMGLIHKNEFARYVAIWYDEFLTAGEDFNNAIKEALQRSGLFLLAVTPNLVCEPNYVQQHEYPMARSEGKTILPVELVATDREQLCRKYPDIPVPTDAHDEAALTGALQEALKTLEVRDLVDATERDYLVGLAYLNGLDVEMDSALAVRLLTAAAEQDYAPAVAQLVTMYATGQGVARNCSKAAAWKKRLADLQKACLIRELEEIARRKREIATLRLGFIYYEHTRALNAFLSVFSQKLKIWLETQTELAELYRDAGDTGAVTDTLCSTIEFATTASEGSVYSLAPQTLLSEAHMNSSLFDLYTALIDSYIDQKQYRCAREWIEKAAEWLHEAASKNSGSYRLDIRLLQCYLETRRVRLLTVQERWQEAYDAMLPMLDGLQLLIREASADTMYWLTSMSTYYTFFTDQALVCGDIEVALGMDADAESSFRGALSCLPNCTGNNLRRKLTCHLRLAGIHARQKAFDQAASHLQQAEAELRYLRRNTVELSLLRRDLFTVRGEVAALQKEDARAWFEQALHIARDLVQDIPTPEHIGCLAKLYEKLYGPACAEPVRALTAMDALKDNSVPARETLGALYSILHRCAPGQDTAQKILSIYTALAAEYPECPIYTALAQKTKPQGQ